MLQTCWISTELSLLFVSVEDKSIHLFVGSRIWPEDAILRKKCIISTIMSLNRALYEGACFKVGLLLGGTEVECWLFTAGCRLQFWKDHFRQWVIFEILHSITYKVSQKNIALALLVWPLHITLLCKIAHLSEMTILKIVSGSPLCVTSLSQCHLAGRFWNIHNTHNSI